MILSMKPAPLDDFPGKDLRKNKEEADRLLRACCNREAFLHYTDIVQTMLQPYRKHLRTDLFLPDGMHLNESGYERWNPLVSEKNR